MRPTHPMVFFFVVFLVLVLVLVLVPPHHPLLLAQKKRKTEERETKPRIVITTLINLSYADLSLFLYPHRPWYLSMCLKTLSDLAV